MDFTTVIKTRRSVRAYSSRAVPEAVLQRILEASQAAPSANNVQPWHYVVMRDNEKKQQVARLCSGQSFIAEADVVIACCSKRYLDRYSWLGDRMYIVDATISLDHLVLAARSEGLGTCWIGAFDARQHAGLKKLLGVPGEYDIPMVTPLGYPVKDNAFGPTTRRKALETIVSYDTF